MTKWKKVLAIIIALTLVFMVFSLASCSTSTELSSMQEQGSNENNQSQEVNTESGTFISIKQDYVEFRHTSLTQFIMYDPVTLVMYTYVEWGDGGGISPMYNPDGTLRLYSPEN